MLIDKKGDAKGNYDALNRKLILANLFLAQSSEKGGMPFIYTFSALKETRLDNKRTAFPFYHHELKKICFSKTACTDGKKYYYNSAFLERLEPKELAIIIAHEVLHLVLQHCSPARCYLRHQRIWNIAVDYAVNAVIEDDLIKSGYIHNRNMYNKTAEHPIWKGNIGQPKPLTELIDEIRSMTLQDLRPSTAEKVDMSKAEVDHDWMPDPKDVKIYADHSQFGRSPEDIYNEIMGEMDKKRQELGLPTFQEMLDMLEECINNPHEVVDADKAELMSDILNAVTGARRLSNKPGTVPGAVDDMIEGLMAPKMKWQDLSRVSLDKTRSDNGRQKTWSSFKRRGVALGHYIPKNLNDKINWVCLLDTSGSMSNEDMAYGVSQLKGLDPKSRGLLVCADAQVYWDQIKEISSVSDLNRIKVIGRGGSVFDDFFENYKAKLKNFGKIDLIIVITDGYWSYENLVEPKVPVEWVITSENKDFNPKFGKVSLLRNF